MDKENNNQNGQTKEKLQPFDEFKAKLNELNEKDMELLKQFYEIDKKSEESELPELSEEQLKQIFEVQKKWKESRFLSLYE